MLSAAACRVCRPSSAAAGTALGVDLVAKGCFDLLGADLPLVDKSDLARADACNVAAGLRGPQPCAVGKCRQDLASHLLVGPALMTAERVEVPIPADPLRHVGQYVEQRQVRGIEFAPDSFSWLTGASPDYKSQSVTIRDNASQLEETTSQSVT